ncbi:DUF1073 domain-containing protein [Gilliamella apicola]|uniref:anti-CBASS protein Acb1 family protein n=1 Tax=Gilliamella apicola TaxID=1196095 RepID=UPI000A3596BD|nr:anti-CBASS Acb1 family protein [Gilliamella apicola]OTP97231.1 DUF1073 domain-containing protein [Gilliamella apicola]OTQ19282.1 DUF1073 domain-containing protein [Gilliamella apicola]OTQ21693.1 DUF1073 domain-containing protein [Gilliamella apicola]OTQ23000.1 DUF1073 domain-containing protein [Gilliamella apicola]
MNSQLQLAVNHALAVNQSLSRQRLAYGSMPNLSGNTKRDRIYEEFGYPKELNFSHFYNMYDRNAIASAGVDRLIDGCWEDYPEVFEGDKQKDAEGVTGWDKTIAKILKKWFPVIKEADKRGVIGSYSAILLQVRDSKDWSEPIDGNTLRRSKENGLVRFIPVWEAQLDVSEWDTDPNSEDYGYPRMYRYISLPVGKATNAPAREIKVHPDRVIILCERAADGLLTNGYSILKKGYNDALDLEKVSGGAAEGFLKNASRQLNFNFSKEVDLGDIAKLYNVEIDQLANAMDEQVKKLNQSTDSSVIMQDGNVSVLSVAPADPSSSFNTSLSKFAASIPIPVKVLIGQITGERASTEDNKDWAKTRMSRRNGFLTSVIESLIERLWRIGIINPPKGEVITVSWSDLLAPSYAEKLDNANKLADVATKTTNALGVPVIKANEIRAAAELPTLPEFEDDMIDKIEDEPLDDKQDKKSDNTEE